MGKGLDPATVRDIKALVKSWKTTQRLAVDQARTPQMPYSSITGSIPVYDDDGNVAARLGRQDDGSYAPTVTLGPVPPQPSPPVVSEKNVGQASITWDGHWLDDVPGPLDFARVEVHLTADPDATLDLEQSSTTRWASIVDPAGGTAAVSLDAGTWFARLVARSQADRTSEPSEPAQFEVKSVLDRDEIIDVVEAAGGGFSLISATTPPPDPDPDADLRREGDMWWQRHPGPAGAMFAAWRWESGAWVEQPLTTEVFDFVNAAHIRGDLVQAMRIIGEGFIVAGDPEGANASMTADGFQVSSVTEEGTQYVSIRLGSGSDEWLQIIKVPGEPPVASISSDGQMSAQSATFASDVTIAGQPLVGKILDPASDAGLLDMFPRGPIGAWTFRSVSRISSAMPENATTVLGQIEATIPAGRAWRFSMPYRVNPAIASGTPGTLNFSMRAWVASTNDGSEPPDPVPSAEIAFADSSHRVPPVGAAGVSGVLRADMMGDPEDTRVKIQIGALTAAGCQVTPSLYAPRDWYAVIEDTGPVIPTVIAASEPGIPTKRTYTSTWRATSSRAWYNSSGQPVTISGNVSRVMRQGEIGGDQTHSAFVCAGGAISGEVGKTIPEATLGATVTKVEVWVYAQWWRKQNNQCALVLMPWTGNINLPSTHTVPLKTNMFGYYMPAPPAGQGRWVTIGDIHHDEVVARRGVLVGPIYYLNYGDPTLDANLGGAAHEDANQVPRIRITYTR